MSSKSKSKGSGAYNLFCESATAFVQRIPPGRVMTYGGIANHLPRPEGIDPHSYARIRARWVGYALKACPEDVPWWRVVNAEGRISQRMGHGPNIQRIYLEQEGIVFEDLQHISLKRYLWEPVLPDH